MVCIVFWYTPRYRLPASAGLLPLAALAIGVVVRDRGRAWPALVALAAGALFSGINSAVGFDQHELHERRHAARMAAAFGRLDRHDQGLRFLRQDLALAPADPEATSRVVMLLLMLGRDAEAMETLTGAPASVRELAGPRTLLAWTLATSADPAARDGARALSLAEGLVGDLGADPERLDVRAAARARAGDFEGAVEDAERAASALTEGDPLRTEIEARLQLYRSGSPYTQPMSPER
jgi:predicted Zn-dependent protease